MSTTKKIEIVDIETASALLGCKRENIYAHYLKKKILSPVPRVGKKSYFFLEEINKILNEKLADIAARRNLRLQETEIDYKLVTDEFKNTYTELTIK